MSQRSLAALIGVGRPAVKDRLERAQLKIDRASEVTSLASRHRREREHAAIVAKALDRRAARAAREAIRLDLASAAPVRPRTGDRDLNNVTMVDTLPTSVHFLSMPNNCTRTTSGNPKTQGGTITCNLGVTTGHTTTTTIVVTPTTAGKLTDTASGTSPGVTPDNDDNQTVTSTVTGT